jgi:hypothetical protein
MNSQSVVKWTAFGLLVILLLIIYAQFGLKVRVICRSQIGECPTEVNKKLLDIKGKSLFSAKRAVKKIVRSDILISDFRTQLKLPNILQVNTIVKRPQFSIFNKPANSYILVNSEGVVLTVTPTNNLPFVIKENVNYTVGQQISAVDRNGLNLIRSIKDQYGIGVGTIQNDTLVVDLPGGIRVIFPLDNNNDVLLGALRLIYTKITSEYAGKYSQIDLRYKNPILR